jgi:valyl-tRNA synthetase
LNFEGNQVVNGTEGQIVGDLERTREALTTLVQVFECALRLLSPFMPFITEEIWHAVYDGKPPAKSIALSWYPQSANSEVDNRALGAMIVLENLITETRALRKDIGVEDKVIVPIEVCVSQAINASIGGGYEPFLRENRAIVERLARVSEMRFVRQIPADRLKRPAYAGDVAVIYEKTIDVAAERERLTKDIARYEKGLAAAERQLGNEAFLAKAPAHVVEGLKKQEAETRLLLEKAMAALTALQKE